jgi:hypothetical protein
MSQTEMETTRFHDPSPKEDLLAVDGLVAAISSNFFELGERLSRIKSSNAYEEEEYISWADYVTKRLPFSLRTADHYVEIWKIFGQQLGIAAEDVVAAGWAKLSHVTKLVQKVGTEEEARKWLTLSKIHSKDEIETLVRERRKELRTTGVIPTPQTKKPKKPESTPNPTTPAGDPPRETISFVEDGDEEGEPSVLRVEESPPVDSKDYLRSRDRNAIYHEEFDLGEGPLHKVEAYLFQPQHANLMGALELASAITGSTKAGHLLDVISTDFRVSNASTPEGGAAIRLTTLIKIMQATYGVRIPTVEVLEHSWIKNQDWLKKSTRT